MNNKSMKGFNNMTTIIIKDDKDLLKIKKGDTVIDERPNNNKDQELERHIEEVEEERVKDTGQL
tara:strand:+ start:85 stop:276 length:192 start_codon:yes stop_codon:yes gene_type:complete